MTVLCPVIPTWNGYKIVVDENDDTAVAEWQPRLDGTKMRYKCGEVLDQGVAAAFGGTENTARYRFADLDTNAKTAYCRNGQWIPPLVPCIGKYTSVTSALLAPPTSNSQVISWEVTLLGRMS